MKVTTKSKKDKYGYANTVALTIAVEKKDSYGTGSLLTRLGTAFSSPYESIIIRGKMVKVVRNL
jgi:hypothetical protein